MAKGMLLAWSSPVTEESDAEFTTWYEKTHIPQVRTTVPSISAVHRYRTADLPGAQQPAHRYLAVYEMDSADVPAAAAALGLAVHEGRIDMTDTMDFATNPPVMQWYRTAE